VEEAIDRRGRDELGLTVREVRVALPDFRYRATDASGIVENEVCPVYLAVTDEEPRPNPDEVMDLRWVDPAALGTALRATPWAFSRRCGGQAPQRARYTPEVVRWPSSSPATPSTPFSPSSSRTASPARPGTPTTTRCSGSASPA